MSKEFPGVKALDRVSLEVSGGVVHGIVGENGAGKSTLMKILSGVYEKDSGEVVFEGKTIDKITPLESMQMGLAIIYQELNLVNTMTVGENVFLGRFSESGGRRGVHAKARKLLDSIGSKVSTHRMVSELSVSDKQMVEIAKALSFELEAHHHGRAEQQPHGRRDGEARQDHPRPEEPRASRSSTSRTSSTRSSGSATS